MLRKVIVLNDLQSNLLSEAILILKEEIDIKDNNNTETQNIRIKSAVHEANNIIEEYMYKLEKENTQKKNFFNKIMDKVKQKGNKF